MLIGSSKKGKRTCETYGKMLPSVVIKETQCWLMRDFHLSINKISKGSLPNSDGGPLKCLFSCIADRRPGISV